MAALDPVLERHQVPGPTPASVSSKSTVYGIQLFKGLYWLEWLIPGMQAETLDGLAMAPISLLILTGLIAAGRAASVMLEPIGLIGYLSGLRVIDEVGLVTPWIAEERRKGDGWYARVIEREHPDYVVIRRDWLKGEVSWAGVGAPFASPEQAASTMPDYEPLRARIDTEDLPAGAGTLLLFKLRR